MRSLAVYVLFIAFSVSLYAQMNPGKTFQQIGDEHWDWAFDSSNSVNGPVYAIAVGTDGIYVGGHFSMAGNVAANNIARWDGDQWYALGDGVNSGGGPPCVYAISIHGADVYAGGQFYSAGSVASPNIAHWDGTQWTAFSGGANNTVRALACDSSGNLYAGGDFTNIGMLSNCMFIAKWDGTQWTALGAGLSGCGSSTKVNALATDGSNIFAGGEFLVAGSDTAKNIARWDGSAWSAIGLGTDGPVFALDYKTQNIYCGGDFVHAGGLTVNYVAKYTAGSWSAIDHGVDYPPAAMDYGSYDIFVGTSLALVPAVNIAKYDCCWDPLGSGTDSTVYAIAANGNDLWVGGVFSTAGSKPSYYFGHWNPYIDFSEVESYRVSSALYITPNPGNGLFTLHGFTDDDQELPIDVFNITGQCVYHDPHQSPTVNGTLQIDLSDQPEGIYFYRIAAMYHQISGRVIIAR
jgi:hypothetical protein